MRDGPTFAEILVSKLGTPPEPFELGDALAVCALVAALVTYFALEYGLGRLIDRIFRWLREGFERRQ